MLQETVNQYMERNEVTFILQAVNGDGEVLVKAESTLSFDDVSDNAWQLDQAFNKLAVEAEESKDDDLVNAEVKDEFERSY